MKILALLAVLVSGAGRAAELELQDKASALGSLQADKGIAVSTKAGGAPALFASSATQPGNVGIWTSNPQTLLQVGGGTLSVTLGGQVGIGLTNPSATLTVNGALKALSLESASSAFIQLLMASCITGCAGNHTLNQWADISAGGYSWTAVNNSPATFSHNGAGRVTLLKGGTFMIRLHGMMMPTADAWGIAALCPILNGSADCSPNSSLGYHHHWYPAGWWAQFGGPFDFVRDLPAGTTVGWGYQPREAMNYWAYDNYTALEIIRIN
jgi:hypothetical protein